MKKTLTDFQERINISIVQGRTLQKACAFSKNTHEFVKEIAALQRKFGAGNADGRVPNIKL